MFYLNLCCFDEILKYGNGANFWGYLGTKYEALYVELCKLLSVK